MRGQTATAQRIGGVFSVGRCGEKVSAQGKEYFCLALVHRLDRMHRVVTMKARRGKIEFPAHLIQKVFAWLFPNSHRAIPLHVAVTAHRTQTTSRVANRSEPKPE